MNKQPKIKSLYRDYIQKSRLFLYPALGIARGVSSTPIETYASMEGRYTVDDNKFICTYHIRQDREFRILEDTKLLGNPLFHEYFDIDEGIGAYVFDFSEDKHLADFQAFVAGRYSKFSEAHKRMILKFFKNMPSHFVYLESYVRPEKYIPLYAELLSTEKKDVPSNYKLLTEVGELCSKPDHELETLKISQYLEDKSENLLNLQDNQQNNHE